jgi:hypothetical protein
MLAALEAQAAQFQPSIECPAGTAEVWVNAETVVRFEGYDAIVTDSRGERRYVTGGAGTGISTRVAALRGEETIAYDWGEGDVLIWDGAEFRPECR